MRLEHDGKPVREFYAALPQQALVGIGSTGYALWFAEMLRELGHELAVGHAAEIRARAVRKQKNGRRDAGHLMELLANGTFPRLWLCPAPRSAMCACCGNTGTPGCRCGRRPRMVCRR